MIQALDVNPDVIDRCRNHVLSGSRFRRHYLLHEYTDEKREAWNVLGAEIETILAAAPAPLSASVAAYRPVAPRSGGRASNGPVASLTPAPRRSAAR